MSIERFRGIYTPICDECENEIPGAESYKEAMAAMFRAGWEIRRNNNVATHICTDCIFKEKGYEGRRIRHD
jgi:uncharacterized protein YlaI